ncbi:MAG: ABC transporter permease [Acidobacteriota bacterium]|nr:ABC transporter permease [Acidobacteriota bacterium]
MMIDDFKLGWRQLIKSPGFSLTAILTLGLAIGANTAVFSLVDAVMLRPLPYPQPDRLAELTLVIHRNGARLGENSSHTGAVWEAVRDQAKSIDAAVFSGLSARINLVAANQALPVFPQRVSAGYFGVLGVPPLVGREFSLEEDRAGGPAVTVLSDRLWRSAFHGDTGIVGQTVLLKGEPHTVVGIMPPSFRTNSEADLWTPIRPSRSGEGSGQNYGIVARLRDGVSWTQAAGEVAAVADPALQSRSSSDGVTASHGLRSLQESLTADVRTPLVLLGAAVGLVLLVACVNLAGLLLARAGRRTREIATRLAVGGDRRTVVRQLLIESLVLAVCGGLVGLAFGAAAIEALKASASDLLLTPWGDVGLDGRVLLVTMALTLLTTIVFGLVPAVHATRVDVQAALARGGTRSVAGGARGWPRRLLVMAEVALGVVLLVGAGLLIRTFIHLQTLQPGFDSRNVIAASASLEDARYEQHERVQRLFEDSLARLRAVPGVESAAVSLGLPYERILNMSAQIVGADGPGAFRGASMTYVTPGYFETLKLPLRAGRSFSDRDTATSAPAIVINEAFARRHFDNRNPIGERVLVANVVREVVGVAANVQQRGGFGDFAPIDVLPSLYVPFSQFQVSSLRTFHGWFMPAWIMRASAPGAVTEPAIRRAMAEVDPQLPFAAVRAVDEVRSAALARQRLLGTLVGLLGAAALFLAAIGIHGLIASGVAERTRELGIRMALGATVGQTVRDAALPGVLMAVAGLVVGCGVALGVSGLLRSLLWGVRPNDPLTFGAVVVTLLVVSLAASVLPALRVRRLDPVSLLRSE